jgi:hypothetical protein
VVLAGLEVRDARLRGGRDAAVPGRDRTIGIGGLLGAQRRELGAELRGVGRGNGCVRRNADEEAGDTGNGKQEFLQHESSLGVRTST